MKKLSPILLALALALAGTLFWSANRSEPVEPLGSPLSSPMPAPRQTAAMPAELAGPEPGALRSEVPSGRPLHAHSITRAQLEAAVERYFDWLDSMSATELKTWLKASDPSDVQDPVRAALFIDDLAVEATHLSADETLYAAYRTAARRLEMPLVERMALEFQRQTLGASEALWKHSLSRLTGHLDRAGLRLGESAVVFTAAYDYLAGWTPDADLRGSPWSVLLPLLRAAAALPDNQLLDALVLLEVGLEREVLDSPGVMHQIALLPALMDGNADPRGSLDAVIPWLQDAQRPSGIAWGYVELLRAMRIGDLIDPDEAASPLYTPDSLFDREPEVAWAALELLAGFGGPSAGERLRAVFWHWLERIRAGDTRIRPKDISVALDFALQAENGLSFEELLPLFDDPLVGGLLLDALVFLAEKDPSDARIQAIWREAVENPSIDGGVRVRMLRHMITFDMATIGELDRWLFQDGLQEMAAWGLLRAGEIRPFAMTEIAVASRDEAFATDVIRQLAEAAPEEGDRLAERLLDANLISLRTRGATWLVALACLAERRGQSALAARYRSQVSALGPDRIDASAFEGTGTLSGSELLELLTPSFLAEPDRLDGLWLGRALPEPEKPESE